MSRDRPSTPLAERLWSRVDRGNPDECWPWIGSAKDREGRGRVQFGGRRATASRVAYELVIGPIGEGLELDHLCRNPSCCNPAHLEPVTHRENVLRGEGLAARNARKTHCKRGHEFTPENTIVTKRGTKTTRSCRRCRRERTRN